MQQMITQTGTNVPLNRGAFSLVGGHFLGFGFADFGEIYAPIHMWHPMRRICKNPTKQLKSKISAFSEV